MSRTILYIGKSEAHAIRSVKWIRRQITHNTQFANTFQLSKGAKWQDVECEIQHGVDEHPIWLLAMGITGSVRGINEDDYRPDLIVLDDVLDEENTATLDQRTKIEKLVYGALKNSLAPATESPDAKIISLNTPHNKDDYAWKALEDREWTSARYGCWTAETKDLPLAKKESSWPARYPSATLRLEYEAAAARNSLATWNREKEVRITSVETSDFDFEWLQYYDDDPPGGVTVVAVDPVPPPSPIAIAKGLTRNDYEVFAAVTRFQGSFYVREIQFMRGHDPDWSIMQLFAFGMRWKPRCFSVEAVAYQRTLHWIFKKAMEAKRIYYVIKDFPDRRSKRDRIIDGLKSISVNRKLYIKRDMIEFVAQYTDYPAVSFDDIIEAVATACAELQGIEYHEFDEDLYAEDGNWQEVTDSEAGIPALEYGEGSLSP